MSVATNSRTHKKRRRKELQNFKNTITFPNGRVFSSCRLYTNNTNIVKFKVINEILHQYCQICTNYLPLNKEFFREKNRNVSGFYHCCKTCHNQHIKKYRYLPGKISLRQVFKEFLCNCKTRKSECRITIEDLLDKWNEQKGLCALTGKQMTYVRGKGRVDTNVSVDRKNNNLGYTKDNIQLVCTIINVMKYTLTKKDLFRWCKDILTYNKKY